MNNVIPNELGGVRWGRDHEPPPFRCEYCGRPTRMLAGEKSIRHRIRACRRCCNAHNLVAERRSMEQSDRAVRARATRRWRKRDDASGEVA